MPFRFSEISSGRTVAALVAFLKGDMPVKYAQAPTLDLVPGRMRPGALGIGRRRSQPPRPVPRMLTRPWPGCRN